MKVIVGKSGSGRTEALIRMAGEHSAYIVVGSMQQAANVMRRAKEMGVQIPFPLTHDEFRRGAYLGRGVERIVVADVDALVQGMARDVRVLAISATEPTLDRPAGALSVPPEAQDLVERLSETDLLRREVDRFAESAREMANGWRAEKARRRESVFVNAAGKEVGVLVASAEVQAEIEQATERIRLQQEEAFRCLGVPGSEVI